MQGFHKQDMVAPADDVHSSMNQSGQVRRAAWIKIYQIINGDRSSHSFPQSTGAVGDINSGVGSSNAKLSDAAINSMNALLDGYTHIYRVTSSECGDDLFIRTTDSYVDTSPSFGVTQGSTQLGLGSGYSAVSTWATLSSTSHGFDLLHSSPGIRGQSCCRYFIGYGGNDCWKGPGGQRCIN
eukprot:9485516-Pyramimonas_sp.AAC.1